MNSPARPRWYPLHWLVVAATLLAAIIRFWNLSGLPPQAWYDEIWFALRARDLLGGDVQVLYHFSETVVAGSTGLVYLTALARWLGIGSIVAARVVAALAGVLTVPLAYACFRQLFRDGMPGHRRVIAALSALILSYLLFMVILSRVGMEPSMAPPAALFGVWQMVRGLRRADWRSWALAGLVAGLAQYNGHHARLILPLAGYLIVEWFFAAKRKGEAMREVVGGAAVMGAVILVVTLPLSVTVARHPDWLLGRAANVSEAVVQEEQQAGPSVAFAQNGLRVLGDWLVAGDANARHNLPGQPMLDPVLGIGFLVGLGWAAWNIRHQTARLLIVWLLLMALPAALTAEAPNMQRMIGVAPPTAALVAMGWVRVYGWLRRRGWGDLRVAHTAGAVLIVASLGWNVYLLVGRWAHSPQLPEAFTSAPVELARQMLARAQSGTVYAERIPEDVDLPAFDFLFDNTPVTRVDFRECLPLDDGPVTYLVLSGRDAETLGRLGKLYPEMASSAQSFDLSWQGQATLLQTPAGAAFTPPGHRPDAQFEPGLSLYGYDWSEPTVKAGQTLRMTVYWLITRPIGADLTALFHIVPAGVYDQPPVAQHDAPPCGGILYPTSQWKPGETVVDWFEIALPADLPPGEYEIAAGWYDPLTLTRSGVIEADHPLPDGRAIIAAITVTAP